ncbi:unnamed protein product [Spirodela intermedia]|uniref:Uncharacterized protein n=2 Tax=Spirodela intermedia TaxID=51605 RepID=A0A7I8KS13_SPIIN|nr:unnamed protein product [Spirodela intermedia]CAA6663354.1 unnamed protein product [Spirodela intermedia]CAA7399814.1 unnamed protein product [Spirodela intermedia]
MLLHSLLMLFLAIVVLPIDYHYIILEGLWPCGLWHSVYDL